MDVNKNSKLLKVPHIHVKNKKTYVALFVFGEDTKIKVSHHVLERFLERQDETVWGFSGGHIKTPEKGLRILYDVYKAASWVRNPKRDDMCEKHGHFSLYARYKNWVFVLRQRKIPVLITCYKE